MTDVNLSGILDKDIKALKNIFDRSSDMVYREFKINGVQDAVLFFIDGFVDTKLVNSDILKPLFNYEKGNFDYKTIQLNKIMSYIQNEIISAAHISSGIGFQEVIEHVLSGETILLIDGIQQGLFIDLKG